MAKFKICQIKPKELIEFSLEWKEIKTNFPSEKVCFSLSTKNFFPSSEDVPSLNSFLSLKASVFNPFCVNRRLGQFVRQ